MKLRSITLATIAVCVASAAFAQCPVQMNTFNARRIWGNGYDMVAKVANDSGKEITAVKFDISFIDATLDEHSLFQTYTWDKTIKADSKNDRLSWRRPYIADVRSYPFAKITLLKIVYADGTTFENSADKPECAPLYDEHYQRKHGAK